MGTTTQPVRNDAAERLLPRISGLTHESNATYVEMRDLLDAALATERRNTVKRIRTAAWDRVGRFSGQPLHLKDLAAILDAEDKA